LQHAFWQDFYDDPTHMKSGNIVLPKVLNVSYHNLYAITNFCFIDEELPNMISLMKNYNPMLVCQFRATVFFHDDPARTITWMTETAPRSATFEVSNEALGYGCGRAKCLKVHSEGPMLISQIAFAYPPDPHQDPSRISGMYLLSLLGQDLPGEPHSEGGG
jgi:hypothetical protein